MAKDYRKKNTKASSGTLRQFVLVLLAFICGYLSSSLFDAAHLGQWLKTHVLAVQNKQNHPSNPPTAQQALLPKPKFEFYTLLANERSPMPVTREPHQSKNNMTPANVTPKTTPVSAAATVAASKEKATSVLGGKKESFLIQVASFKNKQEADRIKASLTLKGFVVNVTTIQQQGMNWYRVVVGPFDSRLQAEKAQSEVARSEHITGMIRKMNA